VIPKSSNVEHLRMNLEAVSITEADCDIWTLSEEDMAKLQRLDQSYLEESSNGSDDDDKRSAKRMKLNEKARLCWLRDPLKMLDFE